MIAAELDGLLVPWVTETPAIPVLLAHVAVPEAGFAWRGAAGVAVRDTGERLFPDAAFRIASTTKTFTAAATLRLVEEGALGLDDPIAGLLPAGFVERLLGGGYDPAAITVHHLLLHTSGVYDYASDPEYLAALMADPAHRWTREEQLAFAIDHGAPDGAPGERWRYSDTGYILLGEIVERVTGKPLGAAYRELLDFGGLGLTRTYRELEEPMPPSIRQHAHQYLGNLDATALDPSFDLYGGGGLVSTTEDLALFFRALPRGEVFQRPETLAVMMTVPPANVEVGQAMGLFRATIGGRTCWGHGDYWGNEAYYCPEVDLVLIYSPNQAEPGDAFETVFAGEAMAAVFGG